MSGTKQSAAESLIPIVRDCEKAAGEILHRCTLKASTNRDEPHRHAILLGLFCKAIRVTEAVRLLCEARLGQEAIGMQRSILEIAATIKLLLDDPKRVLAKRYYYFCHKIRRTVVLEGQADERLRLRFDQTDPDYADSVRDGTIQDLGQKAWDSFKRAAHWHPDYRTNRPKMFEDLGLKPAYTAMYRIGSSSLHATDYDLYVTASEDGSLARMPAEPWLALAMGSTADFLLGIAAMVAHAFDIDAADLLTLPRARLDSHTPDVG